MQPLLLPDYWNDPDRDWFSLRRLVRHPWELFIYNTVITIRASNGIPATLVSLPLSKLEYAQFIVDIHNGNLLIGMSDWKYNETVSLSSVLEVAHQPLPTSSSIK